MKEPAAGFSRGHADENTDKMIARLKEAREYVGVSQDKVAAYLDIPRSAISEIESGKRNISAIELKKLATLYQRPISWFTDDIIEGVSRGRRVSGANSFGAFRQ